jgi:hypothetical protein
MRNFIEFVQVLWLARRAYRNYRQTGKPAYSGLSVEGVPSVVVFIGVGREAWRVSQVAIESCNWQPLGGNNAGKN